MKTLTRSRAVDEMRHRCVALTDDEHSLCSVASRLKILCGGFSQWKFHELKERYDWIVKTRPGVTRRELEDLANRWQLARQEVLGTCLACDTQLAETHHRICHGWDTFSDDELARYVAHFTGEDVRIVADEARAVPRD